MMAARLKIFDPDAPPSILEMCREREMQANWIDGKKTYFVAAGMVAYALLSVWMDKMDWNDAAQMLWQAAAVAGLRHGISKGG